MKSAVKIILQLRTLSLVWVIVDLPTITEPVSGSVWCESMELTFAVFMPMFTQTFIYTNSLA